jgi:pimeloyl-ACP methyl ester carboxylesterase
MSSAAKVRELERRTRAAAGFEASVVNACALERRTRSDAGFEAHVATAKACAFVAGIMMLVACSRVEPARPVTLLRQSECPVTDLPSPVPTATCTPDQLTRVERMIPGEAGELFTLRVATPLPSRGAVVLMHGAGSGGSAAFDLAGASLMRALACAGFDAYAFDARGFGGSTKPPALLAAADANPPAVRAVEAARDLAAVIDFAARTSTVTRVHLIGWSWGSDVAGTYAGENPSRIDKLILLAPVYDRRWPSRHIERGAWREERRADVVKFFSNEREDRAVFDEAVRSMYRFAPDDVVRLPNGPYRDIYGTDAPLWNASKIRAPVLIVRGDQDKASLDPHALALFAALSNAAAKQYLVIGGLGHFLFRERGHAETDRALIAFLQR